MTTCKYGSILLAVLSLMGGTAAAQGIGGGVLPADQGRFRSEIDAGFIYPEFARFKFGDVRNTFPISGGQVIKKFFDERPYAASYLAGAREIYRLPWNFFGAPLEFNARFDIYNAIHHSSFREDESDPEIYVPYIDGVIRPTLTGRSVVGLFNNSHCFLSRKLFSYDLEAGLRSKYCCRNWTLMPGLFFTYQRMQQKDCISTTGTTDPIDMGLFAHINSNHYNLGVDFRFISPVFLHVCWLGSVLVGGEMVYGHYRGKQTFTGTVFNEPAEMLARVNDHDDRWGVRVGAETGLRFFCGKRVSVSLLGNFRYISAMPFVRYPVPIVDTASVSGPAKLHYQNQLTFGGEVNLSAAF